jgi:hypothetical protein
VYIALIAAFAIIYAGVAYNFNQALVIGNPLEQPTTADQFARAIASVMMVCVVSAAVAVVYLAFNNPRQHLAISIGALVVGLVLAIGAGLVAAAIAYPLLGDLLAPVLTGAATPPLALGGTASSAQVPLWARLAIAAPVIAAGLLVGLLEIAAFHKHDELVVLRGELARCQAIIDLDQQILMARACENKGVATPDADSGQSLLDRKINWVAGRVGYLIAIYAAAVDSRRPQGPDRRTLTHDEWRNHEARVQAYEVCIASMQKLANSSELKGRVRDALSPCAQRVD